MGQGTQQANQTYNTGQNPQQANQTFQPYNTAVADQAYQEYQPGWDGPTAGGGPVNQLRPSPPQYGTPSWARGPGPEANLMGGGSALQAIGTQPRPMRGGPLPWNQGDVTPYRPPGSPSPGTAAGAPTKGGMSAAGVGGTPQFNALQNQWVRPTPSPRRFNPTMPFDPTGPRPFDPTRPRPIGGPSYPGPGGYPGYPGTPVSLDSLSPEANVMGGGSALGGKGGVASATPQRLVNNYVSNNWADTQNNWMNDLIGNLPSGVDMDSIRQDARDEHRAMIERGMLSSPLRSQFGPEANLMGGSEALGGFMTYDGPRRPGVAQADPARLSGNYMRNMGMLDEFGNYAGSSNYMTPPTWNPPMVSPELAGLGQAMANGGAVGNMRIPGSVVRRGRVGV